MSAIKTYTQFATQLKETARGMKRLIAQYPGNNVLIAIGRQLDEVGQWTAGGRPPTDAQRRDLTFGMLATKSVEDMDEALAERIYELAYYVDHWPVAPRR